MYNIGDKVIIRKGFGYTDFTNGINRFSRAMTDGLKGVIYARKNQTVYINLEDGRKVETAMNCIIFDYSENIEEL